MVDVNAVCPCGGPESYGRDDARFFFGRDDLIEALLARLAEQLGEPGR